MCEFFFSVFLLLECLLFFRIVCMTGIRSLLLLLLLFLLAFRRFRTSRTAYVPALLLYIKDLLKIAGFLLVIVTLIFKRSSKKLLLW